MPIVSSVVAEDAPQIDGRRHIREVHTDAADRQHECRWVASVGQAADSQLTSHAATLDEQLKASELQACIAFVQEGNNPITWEWAEQSQATGLRAALTHFLSSGTEVLLSIAPVLAEFHAEVFAQVAGISQETAASVIAWAQGQVAQRYSLAALADQVASEAGV